MDVWRTLMHWRHKTAACLIICCVLGCRQKVQLTPRIIQIEANTVVFDGVALNKIALRTRVQQELGQYGPFPVEIIAAPSAQIADVIDLLELAGVRKFSIRPTGKRKAIEFMRRPSDISWDAQFGEMSAVIRANEVTLTTNRLPALSHSEIGGAASKTHMRALVFFWATPETQLGELYAHLSALSEQGHGLMWDEGVRGRVLGVGMDK